MATYFNLSTNMQLPIPIPGIDPGPDYAYNLVATFSLLDIHDHSNGRGVPITPAGMNISTDLPFGGNNATSLRSVRYSPQTSALIAATDLACTYVVAKDLYYNDGNGNQVRITQNGGIAGSPGSISNLVSPASAAYNSGTGTFIFQQGANTAANLDAASVVFRNPTSSSSGVTLSPPPSLSSSYNLVLPAIPTSQSLVTVDNNGNFGAPAVYPLPQAALATASVGANQIITGAVGSTQIAAGAVGAAQKAALNYSVGTSSGNFSTTSTSFVTAAATGSITTNGRPVRVFLQPDGTSGNCFFAVTNDFGFWILLRDSTVIARCEFGNGSGNDGTLAYGPECVSFTDFSATAAAHTYTLQVSMRSTGTFQVTNCALAAYEL